MGFAPGATKHIIVKRNLKENKASPYVHNHEIEQLHPSLAVVLGELVQAQLINFWQTNAHA